MSHDNSLAAYMDIIDDGTKDTRAKMVLSYIRHHPNSTAREIMLGLGFTEPNTVRPRLTELKKAGFILESGNKKCDYSGKKVSTFDTGRPEVSTIMERNKDLLIKLSRQ